MQSTQPSPYKLLPILIVLTFAVYFNSLGNGFVVDDNLIIIDNPWITSPAYLGDIFSNYMGGFAPQGFQASTYRPMVYLLYMAEYALFGLDPLGWHIVNLVLHMINTALVFLLASTLLSGYPTDGPGASEDGGASGRAGKGWLLALPPFIAAALFGVHPVNSETVAWVSCGAELGYTLLSLAAFYLHIRGGAALARTTDASGGIKRSILPAILFFIAMLFKETAVFLIALVVAYDLVKDGLRGGLLPRLKRYIPYGAAFGAYIITRLLVLGHLTPPGSFNPNLGGAQLLLNAFALFVKGLGMLVFPWGNYPFQLFKPVLTIAEPMALGAVIVTLAGAAIVYILRRRVHYLYYAALAMVVLPILPVLLTPIMSHFTLADRYLYFPSIGFSLFLALLVKRAVGYGPGKAKAALGVFVVLALVYSVTSAGRNPAWKDDLTLARASLKGSADNYFALYQEAVVLSKRGFTEEAIPKYLKSINIIYSSPNRDWSILLSARLSLAASYYKSGLDLAAISIYEGLEKDYPENPWVLFELGSSYIEMSRYGLAIPLYSKALESFEEPEQIKQTHIKMGYAYFKQEMLDEAYSSYNEVLKLSPRDPTALNNIRILKGMLQNPQGGF